MLCLCFTTRTSWVQRSHLIAQFVYVNSQTWINSDCFPYAAMLSTLIA
uniref:Uncharacterized protein n=1 Tax=Rhizophora mucronata TaxID=61149 RepID=A0A2P2QGJ4_RHIMU